MRITNLLLTLINLLLFINLNKNFELFPSANAQEKKQLQQQNEPIPVTIVGVNSDLVFPVLYGSNHVGFALPVNYGSGFPSPNRNQKLIPIAIAKSK